MREPKRGAAVCGLLREKSRGLDTEQRVLRRIEYPIGQRKSGRWDLGSGQ